jgi:outer membrane protein assembly factor BamA
VQYLFAVGNSVGFFWDNRSLFLQKIDTQTVKLTRQLPPYLDLRQNGFGLEANWQALDYRYNPRRGWAASVQGAAGFSTLRRNSQIENLSDPNDPDFDFGSLYDQVPEKTTRYRLSGALETYLPAFKRSTFKAAVRAQGIFSSTPVYNNEQFRLGGNKLLRGFNEESLFATRYAVGTAEYRLLIGANAYIAAFADYAYVENITDRVRLFQRPLGLGAGIVFESQAGLFGVSGAVGRLDNGDPFDLRSVKVHLGYVNLF